MGQNPQDKEELHKTADSTFKPKSLRNRAREKLEREEKRKKEAEERKKRREKFFEPGLPFQVNLKPTGINENGTRRTKHNRLNFKDFQKVGK